jgi:hypothetical protein
MRGKGHLFPFNLKQSFLASGPRIRPGYGSLLFRIGASPSQALLPLHFLTLLPLGKFPYTFFCLFILNLSFLP